MKPIVWLVINTIAAVVAFVGASIYTHHLAASIDQQAQDIAGNADPSIRYLGSARTELHRIGEILTTSVFDGPHAASLQQELQIHEKRLHEDLDAYLALPFFPTEPPRSEAVQREVRDAEAQANATIAAVAAGDDKRAAELRMGPAAVAMGRADVALGQLIAFNADQGARLGMEIMQARRRTGAVSYVLDAIAGVLAFGMLAAAAQATRQHARSLRKTRDADEAMTRRLRMVAGAALHISDTLARNGSVRDIMQATVDAAREVAGAHMGALGMGTDPSRPFAPFVYTGIDPSFEEKYGAPRPRGLLGAVIVEGRTLRVEDASKDRRFVGMPPRHPPIGPLLGVPLRHEGEAVGHLYLARGPGGDAFSEQDAHALELLAEFSANAIQNAHLVAAVQQEAQAREDVLSVVSHDLRNPLSAMTMATIALRRTIGSNESARKHVDRLARNASRMERLIGDLLTAAKVQEGKLSFEPAAQEPKKLVGDAVDEFASVATEAGLQLRAEVAEETPPVFCDAGRIGQVLSNLLGNAVKFTPAGGTVIISARPGDPGEVLFSVHDTGPGIPEEAAAHVFDRYWQKREHASRGTGLGLFIAKGIVESHHGRIWVTTHVGEGSDFQFTLPEAGPVRDVRRAALNG
ncbi:MAG TPA: GAF domain-containing sensor histidine kinase [Polyangiaceae bacterium]